MSTEGIQVNTGDLRAAVAAALNGGADQTAELQPQQTTPTPEVNGTPSAPVEPQTETIQAAPQTDNPAQLDDTFELDLEKNPLDASEPQPEAQPVVQEQSPSKERDEVYKTLQATPIGRTIMASNREMARLAAPPEEGGIGFRPEAEQVAQWYRNASTYERMIEDYNSGEPEAQARVVNFLFGRDADGLAMRGVETIAETLPQALAQENPEVYQRIGLHYGDQFVHQLSVMAERATSPEDKERLADAARILAHVTGRPVQTGQPTQSQAQHPNAELEALRAKVREMETGQRQQTVSQIESTVFRSLEAVIQADATKALDPVKGKVDPIVYDAMKLKMTNELRSIVRSNSAIRAEIQKSVGRMTRVGSASKPELVGAIRLWRQGYVDHITPMRANFLKAAGSAAMAQAEQSRTILQQSQNKTAPSPGAAPMQSQTFTGRQPNESVDEFRTRAIRERLTLRPA